MLGVVNLDKPVGPTSHDMVDLLRRVTGTRRIGHAGTLDPLASGVLPILVGGATRFSAELTGGSKRYEAVIRLGLTSATDDAEGPLAAGAGPLPATDEAIAALDAFVGEISQRPPAFSARKQAGRPAWRAARRGESPQLAERLVRVESITVLDARREPAWLDLQVDIRCAAGTYIRSIARDLGERLGCGGHLHALRRTEAAGLRVADALPPDRLEALAADGRLAEALLPVGELLPLPRVSITDHESERFGHGAAVRLPGGAPDGRLAVFTGQRLLGVGVGANGWLQPDTVLAGEDDR